MSTLRIGVVYALFDTPDRRINLDLFLELSLPYEEIMHVVVVNGPIQKPFTNTPNNLHIIQRPNEGFDFGSYNAGLQFLIDKCDVYFF